MKKIIVEFGAGFFIALTSLLISCDGKSFKEDTAITLDQKKLLDKFKAIMEDKLPLEYMEKEVYLIKWLRENSFDIDDAEKGLMTYLKWREDNEMDTILEEDFSSFERDFPYHLESRDKEGRPILYVSIENWDVRKIILQGSQKKLYRYLDKVVEEACSVVRARGEKYKNASQGVLLMDIAGFNLVQHGCLQCIATCLRFLFAFENHYPGYAEKIILVNDGSSHDERGQNRPPSLTRESLVVYGTNKKEWQKYLRSIIDKDQLPLELGGTMIYPGTEDYENYNY